MIARTSRKGKTTQDGRVPAEVRAYVNWVLFGSLALEIFLPLTALAIYCVSLPAGGLMAFGGAIMMSAASFFAGALLGFLFGIPRALSGGTELTSEKQRDQLIANTNLEEVSDWLTKIIVGATLVQLGSIARRFGTLTTSAANIFGAPSEQNKIMAGAIILYSAILGFFVFYIAARSIITFLFNILPSDWISRRQDVPTTQSSSDAKEPEFERSNSTKSDTS
jgi:hypothetical protein